MHSKGCQHKKLWAAPFSCKSCQCFLIHFVLPLQERAKQSLCKSSNQLKILKKVRSMKELDDELVARDDLSSIDLNENVSPSDFVQLERFVDDIHGGIVMSSSQEAISLCDSQSDGAASFCNSQSEGSEIRQRCCDLKSYQKQKN